MQRMKSRPMAQKIAAMAFAPILGLAVVTLPAPVMAAGGGESDSSSSRVKVKCKKDHYYNKIKKRCVKKESSSSLDQNSIFDYGRALAYAGDYEEAISILSAADQTDHRVLNMLGFSSRKLGRMETAFGYYNASIAINPDYSLVRNYLGEAFVQMGDLKNARAQLSEIERICGSRSCDEYGDLAKVIIDRQI